MQQDILYYSHAVETNPKKNPDGWNEAMPLGNGSIGCMVYGAVGREKLQLNEDTIWHGGGGRNRVNPEAKEHYKGIRTLLTEGRIKEAQREALLYMMPVMEKERSYSTAENIWLDFELEEEYTNYIRTLDLNRAVAEVRFECKGIRYKREYFVSTPHQMIVIHQKADKKGACSVVTDWRGNERIDEIKQIGNDILVLKNTEGGENACSYAEMVSVRAKGGKAFVAGGRLVVENADELTIFITLRTDFYGDNPESWCLDKINSVKKLSYEEIKQSHVEDYRKYYDRMSFRLGNCEDNKDIDNEDTNDEYKIAVNEKELTIDERLKRVKNGHTDLKLISLYFNFGRYLMISCSRPGTQPANLQGIWNKDFYPAWGGKYTININTQMNYWPACSCNLAECELPLFDLLRRMLPNGKKTAKDMYALNGFVAHHNTDIFGDCAPQDTYMPATIWPMGGAWLSLHIWRHYQYTKDLEFLRANVDILKEASLFFTEYLFKNGQGEWVTGPSVSPENTYIHASGEKGQLCVGPSMDSQIIYDLFTACEESARLTGQEDDFTRSLSTIKNALPKPKIGADGRLQEWAEEYEEADKGHRHISHLYALYPSEQITYERTPELIEAARKTLECRLENGGGHTGWSRAWIINMWARLRDGEKAGENVQQLLMKSTAMNLFDMHPPFQIDGNFGAIAGIIEMLVQDTDGDIKFLPALPKSWHSGEVRGIRLRGNITVNISWENGKLTNAELEYN